MKSRAIVVGAGIAGLAMSKVLSEHYEEVVLLGPEGAMQDRHLHILLKKGQITLEEIFPGALSRFGEEKIDWSMDTVWEGPHGKFPRYFSTIKTFSMSRQRLIQVLREELLSKGIKRIPKRLESLGTNKEVVLETGERMSFDLLVIAAGQTFPLERILGNEAILSVQSERINLTYRSVVLEGVKLTDCKQYYYQIDYESSKIGGVVTPIEDGKYIATLIEQEELPIKECGDFNQFLDLSSKIPGSAFHQIISTARPASGISILRKEKVHRRRLDVRKIPGGVLICGDVLASLNPVFGQGMTVSLLEAKTLKTFLENGPLDSEKFHLQCEKLTRVPFAFSRIRPSKLLNLLLRYRYFHFKFLHFLHERSFTI